MVIIYIQQCPMATYSLWSIVCEVTTAPQSTSNVQPARLGCVMHLVVFKQLARPFVGREFLRHPKHVFNASLHRTRQRSIPLPDMQHSASPENMLQGRLRDVRLQVCGGMSESSALHPGCHSLTHSIFESVLPRRNTLRRLAEEV